MDTSSSAALEGDAEEHAYTRSYALRQHDDVSDALDVYWKTMLRSAIFPKTVETEGKTESVVQKDDVGTCGSNPAPQCVHSHSPCGLSLQYMSFVRKLHKAMPSPEVDGLELHELLSAKAKESWLRDSKGGAFVTRKMFGDAVFQFAYAWVDGATAENYVQFLQGLFSLLAEEVGCEKWCWREDVHVDDRLTMEEEAAPAPCGIMPESQRM